jgi:hypothetical protein
MNTSSVHEYPQDNDINLVAMWTSVDKVRWAAGIVSGAIAGAIAMIVGGILSTAHGMEFVFPVKLLGTALLGNTATAYGNTAGFVAGLVVVGFISMLWGFVYGHFVRSNSAAALLGMGFTWSTFSWIFIWNLFLHSVKAISASEVPSSAAFLVCLGYGFGMSVIAIVDPIFRGKN